MYCIQSGRGVFRTIGASLWSRALASPTIGTSTGTLRPIWVASMSMWMIRAWGAKVSTLPVTRSSNRMPTPTIRSAWSTAMLAQYMPCMPSIPMLKGWPPGKPPSPSNVVITGMPDCSAKDRSSLLAPEVNMPWPLMITGRSASLIRRAASFSLSDASSVTSGVGTAVTSGNSASINSSCTSLGTSISTGPGRPSWAI